MLMKRLQFGLLFTLLLITLTSSAQIFKGEWKINNLIIDSLVQDYVLDTLSSELYSNYGNHISFHGDERFNTWYTAPCGNDCFISSTGTYVLIDSTHIQFVIEKVSFIKAECYGRISPYTFPLDIGLFYIYKENNQIHLKKVN